MVMANTEPLLTDEQKALLRCLVEAYKAGRKSEFILVRSLSSPPTLVYMDGSQPNIAVDADTSDFEQLARYGYISLGTNKSGDLRGKPTANGIAQFPETNKHRGDQSSFVSDVRELSELAEVTEHLGDELRRAKERYPDAMAIECPFHSAYRPAPGVTPSAEEKVAIDWRNALAIRNERLRRFLVIEDRERLLSLFPLARFGQEFNFGHGLSSQQCVALLNQEFLALNKELVRTKNRPLETFPLGEPGSVTTSRFLNILESDLSSEEALHAMTLQMFHEPEVEYYYLHEHTKQLNPHLKIAVDRGDIALDKYETRYYRNPGNTSERDFLHIPQSSVPYRWEWMRIAVERGPEYTRYSPRLTERKKRELDVWTRMELEEAFRKQRSDTAMNVFLSFSSQDRAEAERVREVIIAAGGTAFMSSKDLSPGDYFAEKIRAALHDAQEVWLLLSPSSLKSEWVMTEWGAAWVLQKRIIPILYRCSLEMLPTRLSTLQCIDLHDCERFAKERFANRKQEATAK